MDRIPCRTAGDTLWITRIVAIATSALLLTSGPVRADKKYDAGVTDVEIKIGQTMPYSGPLSAYATIGKVEAAYFRMVNEQGGINGRKINLISLDDAFSPPKTVEMTRRLVEQDEVLAVFQPLGTPTSTAVRKYLNERKVPQLFIASGATKWADPKNFPWTIGWQPNYQTEGQIYAKYLLANKPNAKVGILYQNDDSGKDYVKGFREGLGDKAGSMIVAEISYEVSDPTVDSQIVTLKASGADTFFNETTPKFAAQAIRKVHDVGWNPLQILVSISASVGAVLTPAGLDKSTGLITGVYFKDAVDPQWSNDPAMKEWLAFMKKYYPEGSIIDSLNIYGYMTAQTLVQVLKQCGDDLTRENVMRQAANLKDLQLPLLLPGIKLSTSPDDFTPIKAMRLARFDGKTWVAFGETIRK
jgi:branched-chain amino acid transport system substrate-binding protein